MYTTRSSTPTHNQTILKTNPAIIAHYEIAGPDYEFWSDKFNMHFGYYKKGMNPFRREPMLDRMNTEVIRRLNLPTDLPSNVLDMGCGLGATARHLANSHTYAHVRGLTVVPWQVKKGNELNEEAGLSDRVYIHKGDFRAMPFEDNSIDFAYAIESSCYASGDDKADLIAEMSRVLRPGGRFVIADVFRKHDRPLKPIVEKAYRELCRNWALPSMARLDDMRLRLYKEGFTNILTEDISWHVAPSAVHVPFAIPAFLIKEMWNNKSLKLKKERWDHLKASFCCVILGLARKDFGYYLISGEKL